MLIADYKSAIYVWANAVLNGDGQGVTVFWGEPNGPRAPNPSVRLKLITGPAMIGMDELRQDDEDPPNFSIVGPRTMTLSITAYGDLAAQMISDLQTSVSDPSKVATMDAAGVGVLSFGPPRDLTELLETKFEQRHQVDANLIVMEEVTSKPGTIESVEVGGSIEKPDGAGEINGDFTGP